MFCFQMKLWPGFGCCLFTLLMFLEAASAQAESVAAATQDSCRLRRIIYRIEYEGCSPRRLLSYACQGHCHSYAQPSVSEGDQLERQCSCCQEANKVSATVTLICVNPDRSSGRAFRSVALRVMLPTGCMCRPCSAGVGVEPLEYAGITSKRSLSYTLI